MSESRWRDIATPIIAEVIQRVRLRGGDDKEIRRELLEAYPFGQRRYHPYRIWCDEIKRQLGVRRHGPTVGDVRRRAAAKARGEKVRLSAAEAKYAEHIARYGTVGENDAAVGAAQSMAETLDEGS